MRALALFLGFVLSAPVLGFELSRNVDLKITQTNRIGEGRLVLDFTLRARANRVTIPDEISPLSGCGWPHFYFSVMVDGKGERVPKYQAFCYSGPDLVISAGKEVTETVIFDTPHLKGVDAKKRLVEFIWLERNSSGVGFAGVLELR